MRGWLLALFRLAWILLAAVAGVVLVLSVVHPTAHPVIIALRLLKAAIVIAVAAILFRRRQRDVVAALLSLSLLLWTITSRTDFALWMGPLAVALDRLRFLLFTLGLLLFPNGEWRPRWTRSVAIATMAVFVLGVVEAKHALPTKGFLPLAICCVLGAMAALIVRFRMAASEAERLQLKWVALGLISGIGCILVARAGATLAPGAMPSPAPIVLEALFQGGIVLIALGFLVSLLRYRLFDVETAVSRSAAYGGLTFALLAIFAGSEAVIETLGQSYFGMGFGNVAAAIAASVAAVLLAPLHHRISGWAEQRFQRDLARMKEQLPDLLAEFGAGASTGRLAAAVLPRISEAVHVTRSALTTEHVVAASHMVEAGAVRSWLAECRRPNRSRFSDVDPADRVFPVRIALRCPLGHIRSMLLLGPRPDGSVIGKAEIAALQAIAPPLRQALSATAEREAQRARDRLVARLLLKRVRGLSERLARLEPVQCRGEPHRDRRLRQV